MLSQLREVVVFVFLPIEFCDAVHILLRGAPHKNACASTFRNLNIWPVQAADDRIAQAIPHTFSKFRIRLLRMNSSRAARDGRPRSFGCPITCQTSLCCRQVLIEFSCLALGASIESSDVRPAPASRRAISRLPIALDTPSPRTAAGCRRSVRSSALPQ